MRHRLLTRAQWRRPLGGGPLTPREQEILHRLHGSQTLREIAGDLYVSHNTVKTITSSLYRKLGAHSRVRGRRARHRVRRGGAGVARIR